MFLTVCLFVLMLGSSHCWQAKVSDFREIESSFSSKSAWVVRLGRWGGGAGPQVVGETPACWLTVGRGEASEEGTPQLHPTLCYAQQEGTGG